MTMDGPREPVVQGTWSRAWGHVGGWSPPMWETECWGPGQISIQSWQDQEEDTRHISGNPSFVRIQDGIMIGVKVTLSPPDI